MFRLLPYVPQVTPDSQGNSTFDNVKRNVIKTLIIVSSAFVVCWTCNQMFMLFYFIGVRVDFSGWFYYLSVIMVYSNSCINPFVYAVKYKQIQNSFKRLLNKFATDTGVDMSVVASNVILK